MLFVFQKGWCVSHWFGERSYGQNWPGSGSAVKPNRDHVAYVSSVTMSNKSV